MATSGNDGVLEAAGLRGFLVAARGLQSCSGGESGGMKRNVKVILGKRISLPGLCTN
jgi:hypothetical protein